MKIISIILFLSLSLSNHAKVRTYGWRTHLPYSEPVSVTSDNSGIIYAGCSESGVIVYNKNNNEYYTLSSTEGLNDTDVKVVAYSSETDNLLVIYTNTNIDLIEGEQVYNISDLYNKQTYGDKTVNSVILRNGLAYISTGIGIVVVDLNKKEIKETFVIEDNIGLLAINDIIFKNDSIIAATTRGIYSGSLNDNLMDFNKWGKDLSFPNPDYEIYNIELFNGKVFVNVYNGLNADAIYYYDGVWNTFENSRYLSKGVNIKAYNNDLVVIRDTFTDIYQENLTLKETYNLPFNDVYYCEDGSRWLARHYYGLWDLDQLNNNSYWGIKPNGPLATFSSYMSSSGDYLYVAAGSHSFNAGEVYNGNGIYIFNNDKWNIPITVDSLTYPGNIYAIAPNPNDPTHFYAVSTGSGLFEFKNNILVANYNETNSEIENVANLINPDYCRLTGIDWDDYGNFWFNSQSAEEMLYYKRFDSIYPVKTKTPAPITSPVDLVIDKNDSKWMIIRESSASQYVLIVNDNYTVDDYTDNTEFEFRVHNKDGDSFSKLNCIEESEDGSIWIGTDNGPVVYYDPNSTLYNSNYFGDQIKISRNDGTNLADYLLATEYISDIKFDDAGRIWFATSASGAYLYSSDGQTELKHFTKENSPLLSNNIFTLGILKSTGEVFFGTDKGIISYQSDASEDKENFSDAIVFPNPVRENYSGQVTIRGLMLNSTVKVTDIAGNIVAELKSNGGSAVWDIKNFNNKRVATGVYLILLSSEDGQESKVLKLLVVN